MADISQIKLPSGDTFDIIDEKSGYITAQYIENKTDYSIPVSRVGEIVVGETAIGTDSTNFPTSKAVVDYVDERVVQEIEAIDVGVTGIKANGTSLAVENGVVNIPGANMQTGQAGLFTQEVGQSFGQYVESVRATIPTSTSQLTNDSGFITTDSDEKVRTWDDATNTTYALMLTNNSNSPSVQHRDWYNLYYYRTIADKKARLYVGGSTSSGILILGNANSTETQLMGSSTANRVITLPDATGTLALTSDIPTIPTNISSFTNDSGYLTASDIASVMTYKGTKANYAALPSTGNTTGDVWHLTDTGAEWAWDGSAWQELGTAIDLSNYLTTSDIAAWAKASTKPTYTAAEVGALPDTTTIPSKTSDLTNDSGFLTSFTETDPTVPSWAKASTKPTYTAAEVGALPDTTTIPSKTSDLTNDSGFITSYTDEKLGLSLASSPVYYYPILTQDTTTAGKKSYDNDGFQYYNYNGTTSDVGNAKLTLGNNKTATTAKNKRGTLELYGSTAYAIRITAGAPTVIRNIEFPNKDGTIALTDDIPTVYSSTNTGGYLTMATLPIYDGTVV